MGATLVDFLEIGPGGGHEIAFTAMGKRRWREIASRMPREDSNLD